MRQSIERCHGASNPTRERFNPCDVYRYSLSVPRNALEEHVHWLAFVGIDPALNPLREHPRFSEVVRRVGLPA